MTAKELIKKLKKKGWYIVSQKGSHIKLKHNDYDDPIVVPDHGKKDLAKGTYHSIIKRAGLK